MTEGQLDVRDVLRDISFGQRVAEEEKDDLARYFVETDLWSRVYDGSVDVVYGPKGSGKSAIYTLLLARRDALFDRRVLITSAEKPRGSPAFRNLVTDPPASEPEFIALWKLYLSCICASVFHEYGVSGDQADNMRAILQREKLIPRDRSLSGMLRGVRDYVRQALNPEGVEAGVEVDAISGLPKGFKGKITFHPRLFMTAAE